MAGFPPEDDVSSSKDHKRLYLNYQDYLDFSRKRRVGDVSPEGFRTALELTRADPEQRPRDILQEIAPEGKPTKEEIARRDEKIKAMAEEIRQLKASVAISDPKQVFDLLESFSMNFLGPSLDHQAVDSGDRDIARELRVRPDELRHYLNKGTKTYLEAIRELQPLVDAAKSKLSGTRKPGAADTRNDHRARLLLEKLESRSEIRIDQAMDIIDGDEGVRPANMVVRRAMKKAAWMRPDKAEFINCCPGCPGSKLRRR